MIYGPNHLAEAFRTVRKNTITIAEDIPADKYSFRAAPGVKTVGEMLAHLAVSPGWQIDLHGERTASVDFAMFGARGAKAAADEQALTSKEAILDALKENGERFAGFVGGLSEAALDEFVSFPPPVKPSRKSRFEMLMGVKEHEMHHRGQLMLIERLLGIVPHVTRQREAMAAQARA